MKKSKQKNYEKFIKRMDEAAREFGFESFESKPAGPAIKEWRQIFLGEDCVPIDAELFSKLLRKGKSLKDLEYFVKNGFYYCEPRDSFLRPNLEDGTVYESGKKIHIHSTGVF